MLDFDDDVEPDEIPKEQDQRIVIELRVSPSSLCEAESIGYCAARDDAGLKACILGRANQKFYTIERLANQHARRSSRFRAAYLPKLREIAGFQARAYAILLAKVSDDAADKLFKGCPGHNIKHVKEPQFEAYVAEVVPEVLLDDCLLKPLLEAFWKGWGNGNDLRARWGRYQDARRRQTRRNRR